MSTSSTGSRTPSRSHASASVGPLAGVSGLSAAAAYAEGGMCDLAIMVVEARYERVHAALMLAVTASALGQTVLLFGMGAGVAAFCEKWDGLEQPEQDAARQKAGVAGVETLRTALTELEEVSLMVCDSGLKAMSVSEQALLPGVAVVGLPTFLDQAGAARLAVF